MSAEPGKAARAKTVTRALLSRPPAVAGGEARAGPGRAKLDQLRGLEAENARLKAAVEELFADELAAQRVPTDSFVEQLCAAEAACASNLLALTRQRVDGEEELARLDASLARAAERNAALRAQPPL